ncbi:MAG: hypothetical protein GXP45_05015 [bacterium]|nr:hypothetical protein [bacterium]
MTKFTFLYAVMLRRILFILVLLGLGFLIWRMINPLSANQALENIKSWPERIFSRDTTQEPIEILQEDTNLEISKGDSNIPVDTGIIVNTGEIFVSS